MSIPNFTYVPAPHERAYYGALFQAADTERKGSIGGGKAVEFFTRSKLPVTQLKHIWAASDQPPTNALDPRKFAVAVRLIQLEQNGVKPNGPDLAKIPGNLRPAFFEGIQPPPSPPQGQQDSPQRPSPPTPNRPPVPGSGASVASVASQHNQLAVQDPFMMTPTDIARYEQIFPEYCKKEPGFLHGSEALTLFGKSGLPQDQLARIWGMVDVPVDNKLDRLEFAIAMHLIICVSRKNLQLPATLPNSLKQLKSKSGPPVQSIQTTSSMDGSVSGGVPSPQLQSRPPPQGQQFNAPGMQQQGHGGGPPPVQSNFSMSSPPGGPPPLQQPNLNMSSQTGVPPPLQSNPSMMSQGGGPPPLQQPNPSMMSQGGGPPPLQQPNLSMMSQGGGPPPLQQPNPSMTGYMADTGPGIPSPTRAATSMPPSMSAGLSGLQGPPPLQQQGGLSISDAFEGLGGGDGGGIDTGSIASYGAANPPVPSSVHMASTVDSIPSPKQERHAVQTIPENAPSVMRISDEQNNHASAARNMQPVIQPARSHDAEEAQLELGKLRAVLQKLQAENISLKAKMGELDGEEKDIQRELKKTLTEIIDLENKLTTLRAQMLAGKSRLLEASAELKAAKEKKGILTDLIAEATATKQAIDEAYESIENANQAASAPPPPPPPAEEADLFGWGADAPLPASTPAPVPALAAASLDGQSNYSEVYSNESHPQQQEQAAAPSYDFGQSVPSTNIYSGGGYEPTHNRGASAASFGEVMGSGPNMHNFGSVPEEVGLSGSSFDAVSTAPSMKEVEDLKLKSKEADDVARDAEESKKQLVAQMEELRRLADEAEEKSRTAAAKPAKKKGMFKRGGGQHKKADEKELQKLAADAKDKKDALLKVQSQVKDAEALAAETKKEAEQLRKQAEDAELKAASAASMQQQQPQANSSQPPPQQPQANSSQPPPQQQHQPSTNGYPSQPGMYFNQQVESKPMPKIHEDGGFGGAPLGFDSNVMGSGGLEIPAPTVGGSDDPYSNPFG